MTSLKVDIKKKGDIGIITLDGLLDAHNAILFSEALSGLISEKHNKIVVDFERLNYLGSSGLEVILSKIQGLRNAGGDIVLAQTAPKIYKVFDLLGLTDFLKFYGSLDEAVSSF